jgi:hypothetical protein
LVISSTAVRSFGRVLGLVVHKVLLDVDDACSDDGLALGSDDGLALGSDDGLALGSEDGYDGSALGSDDSSALGTDEDGFVHTWLR